MRLKALFIITLCAIDILADEPVQVPGNSIFGTRNFIEYVPGDLPLIIAAPHGGNETPEDVPDRTQGVRDTDAHTQELARTVAAVVHARTGHHVHLIICRLHRGKLDANRDLAEAAEGHALAEQAWKEHHAFIDQACATAVKQYGTAFLIDLHGHGHPDPRIELGYLHDAIDLADCEERIDQPAFAATGSIDLIAEQSDLRYSALLRGPSSLGALLEQHAFPSTPSPRMPVPDEPFFRGGYTVARHCKATQNIAGVQIEANRPRLRDTAANRLAFANALVSSLEVYLPRMLGLELCAESTTKKPVAQMPNEQPKPADAKVVGPLTR